MKTVTMYRSADGKVFPTEEQCKRAEADLMCNKVDQFLQAWFYCGHIPSTHKAVLAIEQDKQLFIAQLKELLYIANHSNEDL